MTTAAQQTKALRGTKRLCLACEVRFYDLARAPILCPSCGQQFTVIPPVVATPGGRGSYGAKTSWRSKGAPRPGPMLVEAEPAAALEPAAADEASEEAGDEAAIAVVEDDLILEPEPDDSDVAGLVESDIEEPKEG